MNTRLVLLIAALAFPAAAGAQSGGSPQGSLPAFHSDRELVRYLRNLDPTLPACLDAPPPAGAESAKDAVVQGWATNWRGQPEAEVLVRIGCLYAGTLTGADGSYRLVIPGARVVPGTAVQITASRTGLSTVSRSVSLEPGEEIALDFQMATQIVLHEDVVITGPAAEGPITNNQHEGGDEGGIVKLHGDYLIILRRGRLFTVDVGGGGLQPVSAVDAFGPQGEPDAWYDEILVSGDQVVVIGYNYTAEGTEVGLFRIDREGRLHYRETYHLRSDDYYSSHNSASRLVGTRLVMYAPVRVKPYHYEPDEWMPALRPWHASVEDEDFRRILRPGRIYLPGQPLHVGDHPVLHTVITCELGRGTMECDATAVLSPDTHVSYVSPTAVYVWTTPWTRPLAGQSSMVYRLPMDGSAPRALRVEGEPVDQFSFLESDDGHLNVMVASGSPNPEFTERLRLLRVPLRRFGGGERAAPAASYRALPMPKVRESAFRNRFVGRHLLYGAGWEDATPGQSTLYAVRWADGQVARIPLLHGVDRIEVMGSDAVAVGSSAGNLHFSGIRLGREPGVVQRYVHRRARQGEKRSHGFLYRADAPDQGVMGLPVVAPREPHDVHLLHKSAAVLFVENRDGAFRPLGELAARPERATADGCIASCTDWYGNSRPIFLHGRILALLGYEIVEGAVVDGRIREVKRAGFAPRPAAAAKP
jgi:hypothetical protein